MTKPAEHLAFDDFCNLLIPLGALNSPAELHGWLCGKLSGGARLDEAAWRQGALEFLDIDSLDKDADRAVVDLYSVSLQQFEEAAFGLQLLLPDDDSDLETRAQALGQWCHGFLSGFGSAGIAGDRTFSTDASDALRDIAQMVQIGIDEDESDETNESNLFEVIEYVRVAVLNLFEECGVVSSTPSGDDSAPQLH